MKRKLLETCINHAIKFLPKHPQYENYKHYTYIIQNNKIVDFGLNRCGTPDSNYHNHCKIHSELDAIYQAYGLIDKKSSFYAINIRLTKQGLLRNSKPCTCCYNLLKTFNCKFIWYSTRIGFTKIVLQ